MKKWFCNSENGLGSAGKILVYAAGVAVANNNKKLAQDALPVADGILKAIVSGGDSAALNAMLHEGILTLLDSVSDNVAVKAAVLAALEELSITVHQVPQLNSDGISELVTSFINGVKVGIGA